MDLGEGGPGEEVVGAEVGGHEGGAEGGFEIAAAHEDHAEAVPGIEARGIGFGGAAEMRGGFIEFADGERGAGVIEEGLHRFVAHVRARPFGPRCGGRRTRP